ncbi:unnamed protein product [Parascedosporium putredinis]|uniref:holo-[acyl-carrier-protein] synthase n=1 Tax=Parascedosporium putredinis TaxID=1442378 RepID=A0A9P1H2M9_9PEZI|nr:unnamed protein product [Parascedosporium putredinis]CAI7993723.1 unnamed protein product [Parascedosporium putredinis]
MLHPRQLYQKPQGLRTGGWTDFISVYDAIFSPAELEYLRSLESRHLSVHERLRYFYALWALKEAYVKMTGEALLADWILGLEFPNFRPPPPASQDHGGEILAREDTTREIEVLRDGKRDCGVRMKLMSLGKDYMIAVAVRAPTTMLNAIGDSPQNYTFLNLDDIYAYAESRLL